MFRRYADVMRGWTLPLGRWMGVELRVHTFFLLLLALSIAESGSVGGTSARGTGLWLALLAALVVREAARALTAAYNGMDLRGLLLLPIGGMMAFAHTSGGGDAKSQRAERALLVAGPIANFAAALVIAGLYRGASAQIDLLDKPLMTPLHLIRTLLWMQVVMGSMHLVPAYPLDAGRWLRAELARSKGAVTALKAASGLGMLMALMMIVAGILVFHSVWLAMAGFFVLMGGQMEEQGHVLQGLVDTVRMKDIMLTEYATLAASDTFEDAMQRSLHTLQEDFPVVRGNTLVGVISRSEVAGAMAHEGNGYVQGVMQRSYNVAKPDDTLGRVVRRMQSGGRAELLPVVEGGRVVGIVTLQNLRQSMGQYAEAERLRSRNSD